MICCDPLPSAEALDLIAGYFAALGDPGRLKIVRVLMTGEQTVNALAERTGGLQCNVSRHLGKLSAAGLLHRRKHGTHVIYSIADPAVCALWRLSVQPPFESRARARTKAR